MPDKNTLWTPEGWETHSYDVRSKYMTDDEIEVADNIMSIVNNRADEMLIIMREVGEYDEAYNGDQAEDPDRPNTRINIVHPNIEGQVADISLQEIGLAFQGQEYTDQQFADWARINTEWTLAHQDNMVETVATFTRRMIKYGWTFFKLSFDDNKYNKFGLSRIEKPSIDRVFIDGKITTPDDLYKAEYIAEIINCSKEIAVNVYGQEKADAIEYGRPGIKSRTVFMNEEYVQDDSTGWAPIQWWNHENGHLRLREYTNTGLLLFDNFKGGNKKENQKNNPVTENSHYTHVDDAFPYIMRNCYSEEGKLFGFGDTKLILNLQNLLNTLYDNIRQATKPKRILVASESGLLPEDITDDSFEPIVYASEGLSGRDPTHEVEFGTPNPEWWHMIANIHDEIQRVIRYSELMLGQGGASNTATEAAIQERQGSRSTSMKQKSVESALKDAAMYCLGLDLQFRTGKKALRLQKDKDEMVWVDYDLMKNMPATVPMEQGERESWKARGYRDNQIPETQISMENGKPVTRTIALDLKVMIGAKAPMNPATIANALNQYMSLTLLSEEGKPRPMIFWEEARKFMTDYFGFPFDDISGIKESLAEYDRLNAIKEQQAMAMEQQKAQALQAKTEQSALPNGSPKTIQATPQRQLNGVMQGQADFNAMQ